jgi:hypothetical protein
MLGRHELDDVRREAGNYTSYPPRSLICARSLATASNGADFRHSRVGDEVTSHDFWRVETEEGTPSRRRGSGVPIVRGTRILAFSSAQQIGAIFEKGFVPRQWRRNDRPKVGQRTTRSEGSVFDPVVY